MMDLWEIPRLFENKTVVCLGSGPSLCSEQLEDIAGRFPTIAVNDAYKLAPWADVLYGCDWWWWNHNRCAPDFLGLKVGLGYDFVSKSEYTGWADDTEERKMVNMVGSTGKEGLETENRSAVRTGHNGGYQAVNLAVQMGAKKIVLVGYDMRPNGEKNHFFGNHEGRPNPPFGMFIEAFGTMVEPAKNLGIEILNATLDSALKMFNTVGLEEIF